MSATEYKALARWADTEPAPKRKSETARMFDYMTPEEVDMVARIARRGLGRSDADDTAESYVAGNGKTYWRERRA